MKKQKLLTASLIIITIFTSSFLIINDSYAEHAISLSTSGIQEIEVSASSGGATINKTEINVATTCHAGYNLTLSTTVDDNNLYLDGNSDNNNTGTFFSPSDGITSLISADNTWGFYLPSSDNETPTVSSIFHAVPALNSPITLKTPLQTASSSAIDDTFSIYYGVKVANHTLAGQYRMVEDENHNSGTIVYSATLPEDCFRYTVVYNPTGTNKEISVTGVGSVPNQIIEEGVTTNLTTEVYGNPTIDGVTYYFMGWNTAQDGTGISYSSGQSVTDLAAAGENITLYAQWTDCLSGNICYFKNDDNAEGTMNGQTLSSTSSSITLLPSNFSNEGYGFAGWNTSRNHNGNFYGPNETINFNIGQYTEGDEGLSLYAVWVESEGAIQNWTGCNDLTPASYNSATGILSANLSSITALTDLRDNQTYAVARLVDGNCWMIENLRLSSDYTQGTSAQALSQGYGQSEVYGNFIGLANSENNNYTNTDVANSIYGTNNDALVNINIIDYPEYRVPRYNNINTINPGTNPSISDANYSYGNYYNWPATIANTKYYTSGYTSGGREVDNSNLANTSLCPAGWRLPYGSDTNNDTYNNDFALLDMNMGGNGLIDSSNNLSGLSMSYYWRQFPNNIVYSGSIGNNSIDIRGYGGYLWSTTAYDYSRAYGFSIGETYLNPGSDDFKKTYGFSIRCVIAD